MYVHVRDQTDNPMYGSTGWVPAVREDKEALPCVRRYSWWVPAVRGKNHFFVIWTHFLACEDIRGGSQLSGGGIILFSRNKEAIACVRPSTWCVPTVSLSTYSPLPTTLVC